jgi:predicted nucleic acid-binding protein
MIVIADSSPLIALCRIGRLDLLNVLFGRLLIPDAVWNELTGGKPENPGTEEILSANWIERRSVVDTSLVSFSARTSVPENPRPSSSPAS